MSGSTEIVIFAASTLAVASVSLSVFGERQKRYDGWRWWMWAMWVTTLGAALAALWQGPVGAKVAGLLLMQWPVLTLIGLRRFHPRQALPGSATRDGVVLVLASLLVLAVSLAGPEGAWPALVFSVAVPLYAAAKMFSGAAGREGTPVRYLGGTLAALAVAQLALAGTGAAQPNALVAQTVSAALGAVVLAIVAITLVCERTERQLRDSRRRLRVLANVDTLTQVPNRRHFQDLAEHALQQDEPGTAVLLNFDIDHFKRINDLFGHAAGDRALCMVSNAMLEHLRPHDVPGRQGGDEFALLLRRASLKHGLAVAARIVSEVQRRAPSQQLPTLTLSFGLVQMGFGEGIQAAMRRADQAMFEAKRQGRSRAVAASGDEDEPVFAQSQRLGLASG